MNRSEFLISSHLEGGYGMSFSKFPVWCQPTTKKTQPIKIQMSHVRSQSVYFPAFLESPDDRAERNNKNERKQVDSEGYFTVKTVADDFDKY